MLIVQIDSKDFYHIDLLCGLLLFQEKDTEKVFYGLDDIEGERDIIIVCLYPSMRLSALS